MPWPPWVLLEGLLSPCLVPPEQTPQVKGSLAVLCFLPAPLTQAHGTSALKPQVRGLWWDGPHAQG